MERWNDGRMGFRQAQEKRKATGIVPLGWAHYVGGHAVDSEGGELEEMEVGRMEEWNNGIVERWKYGRRKAKKSKRRI